MYLLETTGILRVCEQKMLIHLAVSLLLFDLEGRDVYSYRYRFVTRTSLACIDL